MQRTTTKRSENIEPFANENTDNYVDEPGGMLGQIHSRQVDNLVVVMDTPDDFVVW